NVDVLSHEKSLAEWRTPPVRAGVFHPATGMHTPALTGGVRPLDYHAFVALRNCMHGLVDGPRAAEAKALVEAQGPLVAGGDLEVGVGEARDSEAVEGLEQEPAAEPAAAVIADYAKILNRSEALLAHALHGGARTERPGDQPRRLRYKIGPGDDVEH